MRLVPLAAFLLAAAPALAQNAAPLQPVPPGSARTVAVPARTTVAASAADARGGAEESMKRAQAQADARAKAWDTKMKRTMGSICKGC